MGSDQEDDWYPIGRRTVLKSAAASSAVAGGIPFTPSTSAATTPSTLPFDTLEGKPDHERGQKGGFFVWYEDPRIHVRFNSDGENHWVHRFDIQVDGGTISNVQTEYWNDTEQLTVNDSNTRIYGRGYVLGGSDDFSFEVDSFDTITFDLQISDPLSGPVDAEEKFERVQNTPTERKRNRVYIGSDSTNPAFLPVSVSSTIPDLDLWIENMKPVQVVFEPDYNSDGTLDFVKDKATAVHIYPGGTDLDLLSDPVEIMVEVFDESGEERELESSDQKTIPPQEYRALARRYDLLEDWFTEFRVDLPTAGEKTLKATVDPDDDIDESDESNVVRQTINVAETDSIELVYSEIVAPFTTTESSPRIYDIPSLRASAQHVAQSDRFIKATFPVAESDYTSKKISLGVNGSSWGTNVGIQNDLAKLEKLAKNNGGGYGVGITTKGYWKHKNIPGGCDLSTARGVTDPDIDAMIVTVDFWTAAAHELGHQLGLYIGDKPEEYSIDSYTDTGSGYWVKEGRHMEETAFMENAVPGELNRWVSNEVNYEFEKVNQCGRREPFENVTDMKDFDVMFQEQLAGSGSSTETTVNSATATDVTTDSRHNEDIIYLQGLVNKDRTLESLTIDYYPKGEGLSRDDGDKTVGVDEYTFVARDATDEVVNERSFRVSFKLPIVVEEGSSGAVELDTGLLSLTMGYPSEVRTLELQADGETIATFQTSTKLLHDAIDRIPDEAFRQEGDESEGDEEDEGEEDEEEGRRKALHNKVDSIEQMLEADNEQGARMKLQNDLKQAVKRWLKDDYETATIDDISKEKLLEIIDQHVERLG